MLKRNWTAPCQTAKQARWPSEYIGGGCTGGIETAITVDVPAITHLCEGVWSLLWLRLLRSWLVVCRDILLGAPSVATEVTAVKELAVVAGALEPGWWSFGFARMLLVGRFGSAAKWTLRSSGLEGFSACWVGGIWVGV